MGGGIAAAFAVQFPHLVNGKVGLVASAGVVEVRCSRLFSCFSFSFLSSLVIVVVKSFVSLNTN